MDICSRYLYRDTPAPAIQVISIELTLVEADELLKLLECHPNSFVNPYANMAREIRQVLPI